MPNRPARTLSVLVLAAVLALAPLAGAEAARRPRPHRQATVQPRQPASEPQGLLGLFRGLLTALWGEDGSHVDPYG